MKFNIRLLYLYLFSFIGLIISIMGTIQIINLGLKVFVFDGADRHDVYPRTKLTPEGGDVPLTEEERMEQERLEDLQTTRQRQREMANSIALLIVGLPVYKYHWRLIKKEDKGK